MQTITITAITETGTEDAIAAIEEIEVTGRLTSTDGEPLTITDDYGTTLRADQAVSELRRTLG